MSRELSLFHNNITEHVMRLRGLDTSVLDYVGFCRHTQESKVRSSRPLGVCQSGHTFCVWHVCGAVEMGF